VTDRDQSTDTGRDTARGFRDRPVLPPAAGASRSKSPLRSKAVTGSTSAALPLPRAVWACSPSRCT